MPLTVLDLVLLLVLLLAAVGGYRAGATGQLGTLLGALAGLVVGGAVATWAATHVQVDASPFLVWLVVVVVVVTLGAAVGARVGRLVGRGVGGVGLGWVDRGAGAVVRVAVVLVVCWLAAGLAVRIGTPSVQRAVHDSAVLGAVDRALPDAPVRLPRGPGEQVRVGPLG